MKASSQTPGRIQKVDTPEGSVIYTIGVLESSIGPLFASFQGSWFFKLQHDLTFVLEPLHRPYHPFSMRDHGSCEQHVGSWNTPTGTPKVCKMMPIWALFGGFGPSFYVLLGSRYSERQSMETCRNLDVPETVGSTNQNPRPDFT